MIVDSSAIVAIIKREEDADVFSAAILKSAEGCKMSAASYLETGIVVDGNRDAALSAEVDQLIDEFEIEIVPLTAAQAKIGRQAYRDFGKGGGHPAKLNMGDCFAYALAIESREALLYKGEDFTHTGIRRS